MLITTKTYKISFYCKIPKKSGMASNFGALAASLGDKFYLDHDDKQPVITTYVGGVHEIYTVLTHIESTCSTIIESIGYDAGLL